MFAIFILKYYTYLLQVLYCDINYCKLGCSFIFNLPSKISDTVSFSLFIINNGCIDLPFKQYCFLKYASGAFLCEQFGINFKGFRLGLLQIFIGLRNIKHFYYKL